MPTLKKLSLTNLRNIGAAELNPSPGFNLFCGINGSGKTTILEAINLLALGRSFRSHMFRPIIKEGESTAIVYGETADAHSLGVQRSLKGPQLIHVNGKRTESLAALSRYLPLQLINSETFQILEGAPKERRQFLDWGVFHVEQPFFSYWRHAKLALLNRNNLLKANAAASEIEPWTNELIKNAQSIDYYRGLYAANLRIEFQAVIEGLFEDDFNARFQFKYMRGWSADLELEEQLERDSGKDRKYGFTSSGPHKADIQFLFGNHNAVEILSRGQLKLLVCALKIAQSRILFKNTAKHCIFLVDDLPAELDAGNTRKVCALLAELDDQVFMTAIDEQNVLPYLRAEEGLVRSYKMFHVKHGIITSTESLAG